MKKLFSFVAALFLALYSIFPACAAKSEYQITVPNHFFSSDSAQGKKALAESYSLSEKQLNDYFKENNLLFLATNQEASAQIALTRTETEFSKTAVSFSRLSDTELAEIAVRLAGESFENGGIVKGKNDISYIILTLSESEQYTVKEYLTVSSGSLYTLRILADPQQIDNLSQEIFKTFSLQDTANLEKTAANGLYTLLAVAGIAIFAAVAVWLTFTVIRDMRKPKENPEEIAENE